MSKIIVNADQVVSRNRGKITYVDHGGTRWTSNEEDVEVVGTPKAAQPTGDAKMADANGGAAAPAPKKARAKKTAKKARAKTESTGVRTIGGKAVDLTKYTKVKSAAGGTSYHNGDAVAEKLAGKSLEDVYTAAAKALKVEEKELYAKYKHLNPGMQRMALGNRMRKLQRAAA